MKPGFWLSAIVVSLGAFIVALPDSGPRIIDISERHGPSLIDAIGLVLILIPWMWMIIYSLIKWRWVLFRLGRPFAALSLAIGFVGLVTTTISLSRDGPYWWMGSLMAFAGQLAWIVAAFKK
jgi:hypothetical protein